MWADKKTRSQQEEYGRFIPHDLVGDILSRLPTAASHFRFRCVNKSWNRHLSNNPNPIHRALWLQSHQEEEEEEETPLILIIQEKKSLYSLLSYDTLLPNTTWSDGGLLEYRSIPVNWAGPLVGCCHGIFCIFHLEIRYPCDSSSHRIMKHVVLWNPSTSQTKLLPNSSIVTPIIAGTISSSVFGFGFDSGTGDYKVVHILLCKSIFSWSTSVQVYSLRNGSWKDVELDEARGLVTLQPCNLSNVFRTHGSSCELVYWYYFSKNTMDYSYIASFDFRTEIIDTQVFPTRVLERVGECKGFYMAATPAKDSLVAVFFDFDDNFEIWGLLRFQSAESWTKLFSTNMSRILGSVQTTSFIGFSGNGGYVFLKHNGELFSFNFETEQVHNDNGIRVEKESHINVFRDDDDAFNDIDYFRQTRAYTYVPSRVSTIGSMRMPS